MIEPDYFQQLFPNEDADFVFLRFKPLTDEEASDPLLCPRCKGMRGFRQGHGCFGSKRLRCGLCGGKGVIREDQLRAIERHNESIEREKERQAKQKEFIEKAPSIPLTEGVLKLSRQDKTTGAYFTYAVGYTVKETADGLLLIPVK